MGFRPGEVLSGRCKPGDIASAAAGGNCLRGSLISTGACRCGRAFSFKKPVQHSAVALVESEKAPGDEISGEIQHGRREFRPWPMKHQAKKEGERKRREGGTPWFRQGSPRPAPFHEPRNLNPAQDAFDQVGRENSESRAESAEGRD